MEQEHHHHHHNHGNAEKNISISIYLNAFFVLVEIVGGVLTNSIAILTDAFYMTLAIVSLFATAWALQKKSTKGRDSNYSYGYKRFSLLGSVFLSGVLTISSIFVLVAAVRRILYLQRR